MKGELRKPASVNAILLIGIFTFVFLGAEYLFVNMISLSVTEGRTVIAQNYALGASAVGFFLYIKKLDSSVEKTKNAVLNSICF